MFRLFITRLATAARTVKQRFNDGPTIQDEKTMERAGAWFNGFAVGWSSMFFIQNLVLYRLNRCDAPEIRQLVLDNPTAATAGATSKMTKPLEEGVFIGSELEQFPGLKSIAIHPTTRALKDAITEKANVYAPVRTVTMRTCDLSTSHTRMMYFLENCVRDTYKEEILAAVKAAVELRRVENDCKDPSYAPIVIYVVKRNSLGIYLATIIRVHEVQDDGRNLFTRLLLGTETVRIDVALINLGEE